MALRPPIYPKAPSHRSWQTTERKKQFCGTWTTDSPRLRKTIDISQNPVVTGMSAICQVSAALGNRTKKRDGRKDGRTQTMRCSLGKKRRVPQVSLLRPGILLVKAITIRSALR